MLVHKIHNTSAQRGPCDLTVGALHQEEEATSRLQDVDLLAEGRAHAFEGAGNSCKLYAPGRPLRLSSPPSTGRTPGDEPPSHSFIQYLLCLLTAYTSAESHMEGEKRRDFKKCC